MLLARYESERTEERRRGGKLEYGWVGKAEAGESLRKERQRLAWRRLLVDNPFQQGCPMSRVLLKSHPEPPREPTTLLCLFARENILGVFPSLTIAVAVEHSCTFLPSPQAQLTLICLGSTSYILGEVSKYSQHFRCGGSVCQGF